MTSDLAAFEYCYRDASNYRSHEVLLLRGSATAAIERSFRATMESATYFIAEAVGLDPLQPRLYQYSGGHATIDDHLWHEFVGLRPAMSGDRDERHAVEGVDELLRRFKLAHRNWQSTADALIRRIVRRK